VLTALVTGGWIGLQKKSYAALDSEITAIAERIRQVRSDADAELKSNEAEEKERQEKARKIDWKSLSEKVKQMQNGGTPDMQAMFQIQTTLRGMSVEELCAQHDEIAAMDLEDNVRQMLQGMMISALAAKDPEMALARCASEIGNEDSQDQWHLRQALDHPAAVSTRKCNDNVFI
jgi:hypothetical protein